MTTVPRVYTVTCHLARVEYRVRLPVGTLRERNLVARC